MRTPRVLASALAAAVLAAAPAAAQSWDVYSYPDARFAVMFPAQPQVGADRYRTTTGLDVPAQVYSARRGNAHYSLTLADFRGTALDKEAAIADAVKGFGEAGKVLVDVEARINAEYGRELTVSGKDGSHSVVAIFFFDDRLYLLHGRATPPDPRAATAGLIRFQQSLSFLP